MQDSVTKVDNTDTKHFKNNSSSSSCNSLSTKQNVDDKSTSASNGSANKKTLLLLFLGWLLCVSVSGLVACGVFGIEWSIYQWIVGVLSTIVILDGSIFLFTIFYVKGLDDEIAAASNAILCFVFTVANLVLWCVFRTSYQIVCYWVTSALLIFGVGAAIQACSSEYYVIMGLEIACCVASMVTLLLNFSFSWNIYQWIIGVAFAIIAIVLFVLKFEFEEGFCVFCTVFTCLFTVANLVLWCVFRTSYQIACYWVTSTLLIFGVGAAIKEKDEMLQVVDFICCIVSVVTMLLNLSFDWNVYQWIIGVVSAIIIVVFAIALVSEDERHGLNCFLNFLFAVANLVLWYVFREEYHIICYWVTPAVFAYSVYSAVRAFLYDEKGIGVVDIVICILSIVAFTLNLSFPWEFYQWLLGIVLSIPIVAMVIAFCIEEDMSGESEGLCFFNFLFSAANIILLLIFREDYRIICYWITPAFLIYGVYATFIAFEDESKVCGSFAIIFCLVHVATLLLNIFA